MLETYLKIKFFERRLSKSLKQEVSDSLSICVLNNLLEVSSLPSLVAINPVYRFLTLCSYHVTYLFQSEITLQLPECQGTPCSKQA